MRSLPPGAMAFDATGRRVTGAEAGVYFVAGNGRRSGAKIQKVIIQR